MKTLEKKVDWIRSRTKGKNDNKKYVVKMSDVAAALGVKRSRLCYVMCVEKHHKLLDAAIDYIKMLEENKRSK